MWFDPYKLLANANFQEDLTIDTGGGLGVDPVSSPIAGPTPTVAPPVDALSQGAGPNMIGVGQMAAVPMSPPMSYGIAGDTGAGAGSWQSWDPTGAAGLNAANSVFGGFDPGTYGANAAATEIQPTGTDIPSGPATPGGPAGLTATPQNPALTASVVGKDQTAAPTDGASTVAKTTPGAGGATGAQTANAAANFTRAAQALVQAAQGGNPQAQQMLNALRQMMMQQGGFGMMGQGQQYNPYMNQFNPRQARERMEQMRRRFIERQRERRALYGDKAAAGAAGRRQSTYGGDRGRGR